jgi:hypothetical protein
MAEELKLTPQEEAAATEAVATFYQTINRRYLEHTGPQRFLPSDENLTVLYDLIIKNVGKAGLAFPGTFYEAWAQASADGLLQEPSLSDEDRRQIAQEFNTRTAAADAHRVHELERKDREAGSIRHKSEQEKLREEQERLEAGRVGFSKLRDVMRRSAENLLGGNNAEPTPGDTLAELTQMLDGIKLSTSTAADKKNIAAWVRNTPNKNFIAVSKMRPDLRQKVDAILSKPEAVDL